MSKRRARRPAKPRDGDARNGSTTTGKDQASVRSPILEVIVGDTAMGARITAAGPLGARPDAEGIDYSDIPDVGDDDAYWTGGQIGPVLPVKVAERPD